MKKLLDNIRAYLKSDERVFAKGICFEKLFVIFLIGSIIGAYYEQIVNLVKVYYSTGNFVWEYRRGVIYGPFNVIYGLGAVILVKLLLSKERKWYQIVIYGALFGGIIEYAISFLQETFTHTVSWDYSDRFLNINGRTTIPYMIFWGLFSLFFTKCIYPFVSNLIEKIPYRMGMVITKVMVIFMIINMLVSWTAIIRQTLRRNDIRPFTFVGRLCDKYYTDEILIKYFPNMIPREEK